MHSLTIVVGRGTPVVWTLLFKTDETVAAARGKLIDNGEIEIADDFGQTISTTKANIIATMIENMNESKNAHIERTLHEMRIRAALQSRAQTDNTLKAAMLSQGPAMLNPVGLNGFGRN